MRSDTLRIALVVLPLATLLYVALWGAHQMGWV